MQRRLCLTTYNQQNTPTNPIDTVNRMEFTHKVRMTATCQSNLHELMGGMKANIREGFCGSRNIW